MKNIQNAQALNDDELDNVVGGRLLRPDETDKLADLEKRICPDCKHHIYEQPDNYGGMAYFYVCGGCGKTYERTGGGFWADLG